MNRCRWLNQAPVAWKPTEVRWRLPGRQLHVILHQWPRQGPEGFSSRRFDLQRAPAFIFAANFQRISAFVVAAGLQWVPAHAPGLLRASAFDTGLQRVPAFAYIFAAGLQRVSIHAASACFPRARVFVFTAGFQWVPSTSPQPSQPSPLPLHPPGFIWTLYLWFWDIWKLSLNPLGSGV